MDEADRHRLSGERNEQIFRDLVVPTLASNVAAAEQPRAVILGGQPGAGKSAMQNAAERELVAHGGALSIVGDDLRAFHPTYRELLLRDDSTAAFYTDRDSGLWVEKLIAHAKSVRCHVVIEGTMRLPDKVAQTMVDLRAAGYVTDARVLAVNEQFSRLGIQQRYERMLEHQGRGRFTVMKAHDDAYRGMPLTVEQLERARLADRVAVYSRGNALLYENTLVDGQWARAPAARQVVDAERARSFTPAEKVSHAVGWEHVWQQKRARGASAQELDVARAGRSKAYALVHADAAARALLQDRVSARTFQLSEHLARTQRSFRGRAR